MRLPSEGGETEEEEHNMEVEEPVSPEFPEELSQSRMDQLKANFGNGNMRLKPDDNAIVRVWMGKITLFMHADLFAVSSPVFRDLLKNSLSRNGSTSCYSVSLQTELEVFKLVKHYLYCGLFGQEVDIELAFKILEFSLYYNVPRLITPAVEIIVGKMKLEHSLHVLEISKVWAIPELEKRALEIIAENPETILESKKFKTFGSYDVIRILSLDDLQCTEEQVFNAASGWAQYGARKKTMKYYFSQVEKCIRFPLMTPSQLAVLTAKADLMDPTDIMKLFQYMCLPASDKGSIEMEYNTNARTKKAVSPVTTIPSPPTPNPTSSTTKPVEVTPSTPTTSGSPETKRRRISIPPENENSGHSSSVASSELSTPAPAVSHKEPEATAPSVPISDSDGEDLFTVVTVDKIFDDKEAQTYEELCKKYIRFNQSIGLVHFNGAKLVQNYRVVNLENCKSLKIDAECKFLKAENDDDPPNPTVFRDFVSRFDPMRFITVARNTTETPTLKNIWSLNQDILLKFNGVTFLKVQHAKENEEDALVLNYISDSLEVLKNKQLKPTTLAISNCEFSMEPLEKKRWVKLQKLVLYRVWGEFTLEEIMKECPCLSELRLWKHMPVNCWFKDKESFLEPPCLTFAASSFLARNTLKKLSLHRTQLKFSGRCRVPCLEELWLEECFMYNRTKLDEVFPETFPSLRRLVLKEKVKTEKKGYLNMATSKLLNCVFTKIETIEYVGVVGMTWKMGTGAEDREDAQLCKFLGEAGLAGFPENFVIEKVAGGWKGTALNLRLLEEQEDNMEYEWYDLATFFDSCECFEDYFIQDDDFPRPQLRY